MEDIREFIAFNADDHLPSEGNYSPPLPLSPKSADSFEEGEEGHEAIMVLLEEVGEGESVLTLVPMHVCTSEAGLCSFPPRRAGQVLAQTVSEVHEARLRFPQRRDVCSGESLLEELLGL